MIGKQTEANKEIKQNEWKLKREKLIDADIDLDWFSEFASSDKIYVPGLNLHEIKNENLTDHKGNFELNGLLVIGPIEHKTNIRYKNMDDFESYLNAIDIDYDSEYVTFFSYVYKLNTPQFIKKDLKMVKVHILNEISLNTQVTDAISLQAVIVLWNLLTISLKKIIQKKF